ncbi:MAG: 1-acyl-sn-glycerol-3-phosphate acyltransferase [Leptospirales bacterium]|nr:1-acyl-sn-glycerol-3-phosphate acyltransferase [Leptospirales bacterium]
MPEEERESQETFNPEDLARLFTVPLEPARVLMRTLLDLFLHIEVSGAENIPLEGGAILVCNHTDYVDVPVQAVHSPRKIVYLGKAELFEPERDIASFLFREGSPLNLPGLNVVKPIVEAALNVYGQAHRAQLKEWGGHPIIRNFRGDGARAAVEYYQELEEFMVNLLKEGMMLSIFPEGTRTETGVMGPFKAMTAKLAIRAGVPIIPSGISGSWKFTSLESVLSGRLFKQTIRYHIGQPILPSEFPQGDEKRAAKELTAYLEKQVYALTQHPERRDHPRTKARVL